MPLSIVGMKLDIYFVKDIFICVFKPITIEGIWWLIWIETGLRLICNEIISLKQSSLK